MEALGGTFAMFYGILGLILIVLALLMPAYVYQIRNRAISIDKKLGVIIGKLEGKELK